MASIPWLRCLPILPCMLMATVLPPLPRLSIDAGSVSVSGISAGADFAVQLQVAYSSIIKGLGVFAGQAYHCAVHRFPEDELRPAAPDVPYCDACPSGKTLIYDHCKEHPEWSSNISALVEYTKAQAHLGSIDPLSSLAGQRVFLYRGKSDSTYKRGAVHATADFFRAFLPSHSVYFEEGVDSEHLLPGVNPYLCWWEEWSGPDNCTYDGARHALEWIYGKDVLKHGRNNDTEHLVTMLHRFDQRKYFPHDGRDPLLDDEGLIFIPPNCSMSDAPVPCKLHVFLHGCDVVDTYPVFSKFGGFNEWAAWNNIVILYPKMSTRGNSLQERLGCYDGYGQTGHDYDLKSGRQMKTLHNMIMALVGQTPEISV